MTMDPQAQQQSTPPVIPAEAIAIANVLKASATREKGDLNSLLVGGFSPALIAARLGSSN